MNKSTESGLDKDTATTSTQNPQPCDLSAFMRTLGFEWSNQAQVFFCELFTSKVGKWHIVDHNTAEHLYFIYAQAVQEALQEKNTDFYMSVDLKSGKISYDEPQIIKWLRESSSNGAVIKNVDFVKYNKMVVQEALAKQGEDIKGKVQVPKLDEAGGDRNTPKVTKEFAKGFNQAIRQVADKWDVLEILKDSTKEGKMSRELFVQYKDGSQDWVDPIKKIEITDDKIVVENGYGTYEFDRDKIEYHLIRDLEVESLGKGDTEV